MIVALFCLLMLSMDSSVQDKTSTDALLQNPFDLQQFKIAKGPSNSGVADDQPYYYKPVENGVYFYFFLFRSPQTFMYSSNGDKKYPMRSGTGFRIVTYKPLGKYRDAYLDPTETLIEVVASYNDPDLPELAFVGLDTVSIKKKLGVNFIRKDSCFIYTKDNKALVLNISEGVVKCLKYARLNAKVTQNFIPERLTEINCTNQSIR
jgi:hypothetical protein